MQQIQTRKPLGASGAAGGPDTEMEARPAHTAASLDSLERHDTPFQPKPLVFWLPKLAQPKRAAKHRQLASIEKSVDSINQQVPAGGSCWSALYPTQAILSWPGELWLQRDASRRIVGYALTQSDGERTKLQFLGVDAAYRRQGFGKNILLNLAEKRGPLSLAVREGNTSARTLYAGMRAHGYTVQFRRGGSYADGERCLALRIDAASSSSPASRKP